ALAPASVIVGAVVSTSVIVWLLVWLVLLHESVAAHVRVYVLAHAVPPMTSSPTWWTATAAPQSVAVGGVNVGVKLVAHPSTCVSAPAAVISGAVVSTSVIVWLLVWLVLLHDSVAAHVRVCVLAHAGPAITSLPTWWTATAAPQSVAVGGVNVGVKLVAHPSPCLSAPAAVIAGAGVS